MNATAKWLIIAGIALVVLGLLWQFVGRFLPLGRLPGDIVYEKENVKIYFPIVTCIILSILLSLGSYLFRLFK